MTQYATTADLAVASGMPSAVLATFTIAEQNAALIRASAKADSYISPQYSLPLTSWSTDLTDAVCKLAALALMLTKGFNPEQGRDNIFIMNAKEASDWLKDVSANRARLANAVDATVALEEGAGAVGSDTPRGWGSSSGSSSSDNFFWKHRGG